MALVLRARVSGLRRQPNKIELLLLPRLNTELKPGDNGNNRLIFVGTAMSMPLLSNYRERCRDVWKFYENFYCMYTYKYVPLLVVSSYPHTRH